MFEANHFQRKTHRDDRNSSTKILEININFEKSRGKSKQLNTNLNPML